VRQNTTQGRGGEGLFRHDLVLHGGGAQLTAAVRSYFESAGAQVPVLAVVTPETWAVIREVLPVDAAVQIEDAGVLSRNPARVIPTILSFVHAVHAPLRVVTEQWWDERSLVERAELARHEALSNLAFSGHDIELVCLYDTRRISPQIVDDALRTHQRLVGPGGLADNARYTEPQAVLAMTDLLEPVPEAAESIDVEAGKLAQLRRAVKERAQQAGLPGERAEDLVLAANELATNVVSHGAGRGQLRMWTDPSWLVCEVADSGRLDNPFAGRRRPEPDDTAGRGLWMVNQLCDLVELRSNPDGTAVRLRFALPKPAGGPLQMPVLC